VDRVVGGMLLLPPSADVVLGLIEAAETAPDELSAIFSLMKAPPMPAIPAELHGKPIIAVLLVHAGDLDAGERIVASMRALAPPVVDMVRPIHYPEFFEMAAGPPAIEHEVSHTTFLDTVDRSLADGLLDQVATSTAFLAAAQLRVLGGAMARVPGDATAFAHRQRKYMAVIGAVYNDPAEAAIHEAWIGRVADIVARDHPGAYAGFLGGDGQARIRDAYPGRTWERLAEVKRRYDPGNLFRLNHNIET
jgi:FAD/FMN-containing dehydrogenase